MSTYTGLNIFSGAVLLVPAPEPSAEAGGQAVVPGWLFAEG